MPFCRKCGFKYDEGDTWCNSCGSNIEPTSTPEKGSLEEEKQKIVGATEKSLEKTGKPKIPRPTPSGGKFCKYCGFENDEGNSYCSKCIRPFEREEIQKPAEKAIQDAVRYLEEKKQEKKRVSSGVDQETAQTPGSKSSSDIFRSSLTVFFIILIILFFVSIFNPPKTEPQQDTAAVSEGLLKQELGRHQRIIEEDFRKIEGLYQRRPLEKTEVLVIQYAEAFTYQAQPMKQHVAEYKDFIRRHESELLKMGMSPAELLTKYDEEMLALDNHLKMIEKELQQMRSNREAVANLLKLLVSLLASSG